MPPLIVILAAGEGTRLYPATRETTKAMVDIGNKKLIDRKIQSLPAVIKKIALIRDSEKFQGLENRLMSMHGFSDKDLIYQDGLVDIGYLPEGALTTEQLVYGVGTYLRNSVQFFEFNPLFFTLVDTLVKDIDYAVLLEHHEREKADVTMLMGRGFNRGSNTRVYTIENGRFVLAGPYLHHQWEKLGCPDDMQVDINPNQSVLTHEGTYVVGSEFLRMSPSEFSAKMQEKDGFIDLFKALKIVPYIATGSWIDVRDTKNLEAAVRKFGE